jgi:hypothetical protein
MQDGIFYHGSSHLGQPSLEEPDGPGYEDIDTEEPPYDADAEADAVARAELSIDTMEDVL